MHERLFPRFLHHALPGAVLMAVLAIAGTAVSRAQDPGSAQTAGKTEDLPVAGQGSAEQPAADGAVATGQSAADAQLEDYEASEQISEDLAVAFPVDI